MLNMAEKPMLSFEQLKETGDLASANGTEEKKIKAIQYQTLWSTPSMNIAEQSTEKSITAPSMIPNQNQHPNFSS